MPLPLWLSKTCYSLDNISIYNMLTHSTEYSPELIPEVSIAGYATINPEVQVRLNLNFLLDVLRKEYWMIF